MAAWHWVALYFRKQGFPFEAHLRSAPFVLCAEPALGTVAEREMTTVAEFFRRELRGLPTTSRYERFARESLIERVMHALPSATTQAPGPLQP